MHSSFFKTETLNTRYSMQIVTELQGNSLQITAVK